MTPQAKREERSRRDRDTYNGKLKKVWGEKGVCLHCLFERGKGGSHQEHVDRFGLGLTPYKDVCYEVVENKPAKPAVKEDVNPAWGDSGVAKGDIKEGPQKEQTPEELFHEMEDFYKNDVRIFRQEVLDEYGLFIAALVDVFNRNLEFVLGGNSAGRVRKIYDAKAQQYLSNLERMIKEMGHISQHFPNLPVKKYIIFREVRNKVDISGLEFMDKNIKAVAEMIEYKLRKQIDMMYDQ